MFFFFLFINWGLLDFIKLGVFPFFFSFIIFTFISALLIFH